MLHTKKWVSCDGCGDGLGGWDAYTAKEARDTAKLLGWKRTKDGRDLCDECQGPIGDKHDA